MNQAPTHSKLLLPGLFLLGVLMRMPITVVPSIVNQIAKSFSVSVTSLGILTTIPLLCFGCLSFIMATIAQRVGNEMTIELAIAGLTIGAFLRTQNFASLIIGSVLIGMAITGINVLLPAIVADKYANRAGSITGMYSIATTLFSAIGAYTITPISNHIGWQSGLAIVASIALLTAILWLPNLHYNHPQPVTTAHSQTKIWRHRNAWFLLVYFGCQSFVFYSCVAWLPSIAMNAGLSNDKASVIAGLFQLFSIPCAYFIPVIAAKMTHHRPLIFFASCTTIIGCLMMLAAMKSLVYFTIVALFLGFGTSTSFVLGMTLFTLKSKTPAIARQLSGMVQSGGYLIAALGPVSVGGLNHLTANWISGICLLVIVSLVYTLCGSLVDRQRYI